MSGQQVVSSGHRFGRTFQNNSSPATATTWARRIALMAAATLFAAPESASAQSFWGWGPTDYRDQRPVMQKRARIKRKADPAEAVANKSAKPVGPLVIAVSVERQRVKVYDTNGLFAEAPVSTGTKSHPTPMGVFSIIQKNRHHFSNLYGGASMPYMQRITWSGVAMHTGMLPGYAASHGCIRMPNEFAARLWTWTKMGTRVIVAPGDVSPHDFSHPKLVAKMVPLPTVSAAPAPAQVLAATAAAQSKLVPAQRTADASEAIAGMKGTLTDVARTTPAGTMSTDVAPSETKPSEASPVEMKAAEKPDVAAALKQLSITATSEVLAKAKAEAMPVATAEKHARKAAEPVDELVVKPEDRNNNDDSENDNTAATDRQPETKSETKSAETPAAPAKPAEALQEIAKPADVIKPVDTRPADVKPADVAKSPDVAKPADAAKPADIASPAVTPAPAKPAVVATPRRNNHVAVFISRKDKKLYIRHGYEPVYDTPVEIADADRPLGTHVFTARGDTTDTTALHWSVVSLPIVARKSVSARASRQGTRQGTKVTPVQAGVVPALNATEALDRITIPAEAMEKIASIITPGGSLLISDYGLTGWETGKGTDFIVPLRQ